MQKEKYAYILHCGQKEKSLEEAEGNQYNCAFLKK